MIKPAWAAATRDDDPTDLRIGTAMTRLRHKLELFGVSIKGERGQGFRPIEMSGQGSAPATSEVDPQG